MGEDFQPDEIIEATERAFAEARQENNLAFRRLHAELSGEISAVRKAASEAKSSAVAALRGNRPAARPPAPRRALFRALVCRVVAKAEHHDDAQAIADRLYGKGSLSEAIADPVGYIRKAATNPARTDVAAWAGALVNSAVYTGLLPAIAPASAYAQLSARGLAVPLKASLTLPSRNRPSPVPSPFVGEGLPAAVRALDLSGKMLSPKKAMVLSLYTAEMARSTAFEAILRQALAEDVGLGIDTVLLSNAAGSASSPPGLLYGVTPITASAATTPGEAMAADLSALAASFVPPAGRLTLIMNEGQATSLAIRSPAAALDIVVSDVLPAKTVIALDAADFASASDGGEIDITEDAVVQPDTAPSNADIMATHPVTSLFQTNLIGIRLVEFIDYGMRRGGRVAVVSGVSW